MSDDMPAVKEALVALYAVRPGDSLDVGWWGRATNETPCFVPESQVASLCAEGRLAPLEYDQAPEAPVEERPRKRGKEK